MSETDPADAPQMRMSRLFPVPAARLIEAWSSADHVKRWFSPASFTCPDAKVEMHVGGAFDVQMHGPDGADLWSRGTFLEITPARLHLELWVDDGHGGRMFTAPTEVLLTEEGAGTRMEVIQSYSLVPTEVAAAMVAGATPGWSETLDKLEAELARMQG